MIVIDGRIAYVGGTGIEDHFADGRFADAMCRVTGPIVSQVQLAILTSWVKDGGPPPPDLVGLFLDEVARVPADALPDLAVRVLMNVPGTGHHPIRDAIFAGLAEARSVIDIVNPYIANRSVIRGLLDAAGRGVRRPGRDPGEAAAAAADRRVPRLARASSSRPASPSSAIPGWPTRRSTASTSGS